MGEPAITLTAAAGLVPALPHAFVAGAKELRAWRSIAEKPISRYANGAKVRPSA